MKRYAVVDGMALREHDFEVPLDHAKPDGEKITVFAREVVSADKRDDTLPWLVFLQGGPGFGSPRPLTRSGWIKRALEEYRVLLLDDRGTGRSTPVGYPSLARFSTTGERAAYLRHFRADAIVQDAEWIRRRLLGDGVKWSILGQSFGGFCSVRYLSAAPEGLRESFICGGLPSLHRPIDDVYQATYGIVKKKNGLYYDRYPDDVKRVRKIVDHLGAHDVRLPAGERLSPRRFQQLGLALGMSDGFEAIHYVLETAWVENELSYPFLRAVENAQTYEANPIFAILHEAIYCQGAASHWSAHRLRAGFPEFEITTRDPVLFTGEMIYPWMFDEYKHLIPLKDEAELLADYEAWPQIYDAERLRKNEVPVAAVIYYNDMYVPLPYSQETADTIGGLKAWVTSEYEHNGIRADGEKVLGKLIEMVRSS